VLLGAADDLHFYKFPENYFDHLITVLSGGRGWIINVLLFEHRFKLNKHCLLHGRPEPYDYRLFAHLAIEKRDLKNPGLLKYCILLPCTLLLYACSCFSFLHIQWGLNASGYIYACPFDLMAACNIFNLIVI
jgi:hypothetical protein